MDGLYICIVVQGRLEFTLHQYLLFNFDEPLQYGDIAVMSFPMCDPPYFPLNGEPSIVTLLLGIQRDLSRAMVAIMTFEIFKDGVPSFDSKHVSWVSYNFVSWNGLDPLS